MSDSREVLLDAAWQLVVESFGFEPTVPEPGGRSIGTVSMGSLISRIDGPFFREEQFLSARIVLNPQTSLKHAMVCHDSYRTFCGELSRCQLIADDFFPSQFFCLKCLTAQKVFVPRIASKFSRDFSIASFEIGIWNASSPVV